MYAPIVLTDEWQRLGTTVRVVQGSRGQVFLGTDAPAASDAGIVLVDNIPVYVHEDFTHVYVKGTGVARAA